MTIEQVLDEAERQAIVEVASDFARSEIGPRVAEYDRAERLPRDLVEQMAELGFFGGVVSPRYGGLGLDYPTFARLVEEIGKVCQAMATLVTMPSGLVGAAIERYGSEEQREERLRPLAAGRAFGAAAVTEPRSGSDVAGMDTSYRREGSDFVLTGVKAWISNLDIADFFITFGTRDRALRHRGISSFIVPRDAKGVEVRPYKNKLGFRPLSTGEVVFDAVRLPPEALLANEGEGFRVAMTAVERGRLGVAARSVGLAQACLDDSIAYASERQAFERSIAEFQIVQSKVCDMVVGIKTARLLVSALAEELEAGARARALTSMAKMYASDVAARCAADAVQIHGAYGVSPEYRVGRMYRDAKVLQIVEGSNDLHRALIGEITLGLRSAGESTEST